MRSRFLTAGPASTLNQIAAHPVGIGPFRLAPWTRTSRKQSKATK
jgi:hypothetical protein